MTDQRFIICISIFIFCVALLTKLVSKHVPSAFMDEIFHVPQVQEYFKDNWTHWDPMITTPPGLYIVTVALLKVLRLSGEEIFNLRLVNAAFGVGILMIARAICLNDPFGNERALLIALLPNLFIFYGLYYTDCGSVFFVLLAYWALKRRRYLVFLLASIVSLGFRQTNIIWTAVFCIADVICDKVDGDLRVLWRRKCEFVKEIGLGTGLIGIFLIAVYLNGGSIVLGDKESHASSLHLAQFLYCFTFCFLLTWPLLISFRLNFLILLPLNAICFVVIRLGTVVHRYLLADNRHWTNFVWRRALSNETLRNTLIPFHSTALLLISTALKESRGLLWTLGYFCTCAIVLIPSPLIEPRYYIISLVFFLLNVPIKSRRTVFLQILCFMLVNLFIVGYFLYRPFTWPSEPTFLQRRIW